MNGSGALTSRVDQSNGGDDKGYTAGTGLIPTLRQANAWVESKRFGKITIGLASQATDGISEIDLSRTEVVAGSAVDTWIGGFRPNADGAYEANRLMYFHFLGNFDGGRDQLIRYDSPTIAGFILSASLSGGSIYPDVPFVANPQLLPFGDRKKEWDVALRYAGEWNGLRFAAGIGYHVGMVVDGSIDGINFLPVDRFFYNQKITGSASLLHVPSGLFLTLAAGWMENLSNAVINDEDTNKYVYVKGGLQTAFTPLGQTVFYGEYYRIEKEVAGDCLVSCLYPGVDTTSQMWGAGIVQHIDAAAMELYAAYRFYDSPNGSLSLPPPAIRGDFHMGQVGMRIRF